MEGGAARTTWIMKMSEAISMCRETSLRIQPSLLPMSQAMIQSVRVEEALNTTSLTGSVYSIKLPDSLSLRSWMMNVNFSSGEQKCALGGSIAL